MIDPKYEKNATSPGLANPTTLKLLPMRVSQLCMRSALLQRGNALAAMGREEEARETYEKIFPLLVGEPRCARVDWERHSVHVNIGNTYARTSEYDKADEHYKIADDATAAKKRDEEAINSMAEGMESLASGEIDDGGAYPIN